MSRPKNTSAAILALISLVVFGTHDHGFGHEPTLHPLAREAQRREVRIPVEDFSLTDQNGRPFRFQTLKGKVVLVAFAYTTCPDVCPLMTAAMRSVQQYLNEGERSSVYLLTITTDPEVDAPQVLASYAKRYRVDFSNWGFLTGEAEALSPVWKNFGVKVRRIARGLIDHTALTAVIDPKGVMRVAYHGTSPDPKVVLKDIRTLLNRP